MEQRRRHEQEQRDAEYAQSLVATDQRGVANRRAEAERRALREREDAERKQKEEQRQQRERRRKMEEEADKKRQEAANLATIAATTKKCPNKRCGWPIEKNKGW